MKLFGGTARYHDSTSSHLFYFSLIAVYHITVSRAVGSSPANVTHTWQPLSFWSLLPLRSRRTLRSCTSSLANLSYEIMEEKKRHARLKSFLRITKCDYKTIFAGTVINEPQSVSRYDVIFCRKQYHRHFYHLVLFSSLNSKEVGKAQNARRR